MADDSENFGPVRLMNAGLDERKGDVVAHGWLDLGSMNNLHVGPYQREVLSKVGGKKTSIQAAIEAGAPLPDIMLGMRGQHFTTKGHSMTLEDPVYIIDGLQRVFGLKQFAEANPDSAQSLRIGAEVRFGTSEQSEKDLFMILNTSRIPVSPNVILRSMKEACPSILTVYGLSNSDKSFPLHGKVQWTQRMSRGELITALMMCKVAHSLHSFDGVFSSGSANRLGPLMDSRAKSVGLQTFRENVRTFFEVLNDCWPIDHVEYRESATHLKGNFLVALARFFAEHTNFWKPGADRLQVDINTKRKLAGFPILDPEVARLASSGTMALPILYNLLCDHFNRGKRVVGRLHKRSEN